MNSSDDATSATTASTGSSLFDLEPATTRVCGTCKVERPLAMFYIAAEARNTAKSGKKQKYPCRLCSRAKNNARNAPRQAIAAKVKAERGCMDCGLHNDEHPEVFEFDHVPGVDKIANIAKFYSKGTVEDLLAEIAKCDVVCANCHRIRTFSRQANSFGRDRGDESHLNRLRRHPRKQADRDMT